LLVDAFRLARHAGFFLATVFLMLLALPAAAANGDDLLGEGKKLLPAVTYKNLTLLPVARDDALPEQTPRRSGKSRAAKKPQQDFEVLDEGMRRGRVKIHEQKSGATVNSLTITNDSNDPLFIMGGEVVIGGKQDRIIAKDVVIAPNSTETISVYCVEHGRWAGRRAAFESAGSLAHTELRKAAKYKSSQAEVWSEVSSKNRKRRTSNATDTYREVARGKSTAKSIRDYEKEINGRLAGVSTGQELLGFVVAMNGEVVAVEVFESPKLFAKLKQKILRSYFVEAVDQPVSKKAKRVPPRSEISEFTERADRAEKTRSLVEKQKSSETYNFDDPLLEGAVLEAEDAAPAADPKAPRTRSKVYRSIHKKK
jgi:hypothetical protein